MNVSHSDKLQLRSSYVDGKLQKMSGPNSTDMSENSFCVSSKSTKHAEFIPFLTNGIKCCIIPIWIDRKNAVVIIYLSISPCPSSALPLMTSHFLHADSWNWMNSKTAPGLFLQHQIIAAYITQCWPGAPM